MVRGWAGRDAQRRQLHRAGHKLRRHGSTLVARSCCAQLSSASTHLLQLPLAARLGQGRVQDGGGRDAAAVREQSGKVQQCRGHRHVFRVCQNAGAGEMQGLVRCGNCKASEPWPALPRTAHRNTCAQPPAPDTCGRDGEGPRLAQRQRQVAQHRGQRQLRRVVGKAAGTGQGDCGDGGADGGAGPHCHCAHHRRRRPWRRQQRRQQKPPSVIHCKAGRRSPPVVGILQRALRCFRKTPQQRWQRVLRQRQGAQQAGHVLLG